MKIAWAALAFIFPVTCIAQKPQNDWDKRSLVDRVKKIRSSYRWVNDYLAGITTTADLPGMTEFRAESFDTSTYWVDSFSTDGRCLASYNVNGGVVTDLTVRKFDARGYVIEERFMDRKTGKTKNYKKFVYDASGNEIYQHTYDINGKPERWIKRSYVSGRVAMEEDSTSGGNAITVYTYNAKGQLVEEHRHSCGETIYTYTHDDKGNRISTAIKDSKSGYKSTCTHKYDRHNNKVLDAQYKMNGSLMFSLVTEYTYDSRGNWVRCFQYYDSGRPKEVTIREIAYY